MERAGDQARKAKPEKGRKIEKRPYGLHCSRGQFHDAKTQRKTPPGAISLNFN